MSVALGVAGAVWAGLSVALSTWVAPLESKPEVSLTALVICVGIALMLVAAGGASVAWPLAAAMASSIVVWRLVSPRANNAL
jgi:hypothetical protein